MNNPELNPGGDNERDYADSLVWVALGIDEGDFEEEVNKAFETDRIGTLARVAARLQVIDDNDKRKLDVLLQDNFVARSLIDIIDIRVTNLSMAELRAYNAIRDDEERILNLEQDAADFHMPYM